MPSLFLNSSTIHSNDPLVDVVAAKVRVAVGGLHLDDAVADLEDGDVERAAAEVVDGDRLVLLLVEAVGERRRGRLVDDALHVEAGNLPGVLRRLPLGVVEVRRHGDHRVGDLLAEVGLGGLLQLLQDHRGDFGRRIPFAAHLDPRVAVLARGPPCRARGCASLVTSSNLRPMNRLIENTVFSGFVTACRLAIWPTSRSPSLVNATTDGVDPRAFLVDDDRRLAAFHDRDDRVGRAQVDPDDFARHAVSPPVTPYLNEHRVTRRSKTKPVPFGSEARRSQSWHPELSLCPSVCTRLTRRRHIRRPCWRWECAAWVPPSDIM